MSTVILLAEQTGFVEHVLNELASGFIKRGITAAHFNGPIEYERLIPWLQRNDVSLCLHYAGKLPASLSWPSNIAHCSWIVDYRQHGQDIIGDLGKSDHLYFIMHPRAYGLIETIHLSGRSWSMLLPGARDDVKPRQSVQRYDFCLAGYIPAPLIYDAPVGKRSDGMIVTLGFFLDGFPRELLHMATLNIGAIRNAVSDRFSELNCEPFDLNNTMQVFDDILIRTIDRSAIVDEILRRDMILRIYGPSTWMLWPQYAPHYHGNVTPQMLNVHMQRAKVNVHNGCLAFHYRVADAIAANAFIMVNRTTFDQLPGGIATMLEPEREYASYSIEDFGPTAISYLDDPGRCDGIIANGYRAVLAHHTWVHRADQIIKDFDLRSRSEFAESDSKRLAASLREHLARTAPINLS